MDNLIRQKAMIDDSTSVEAASRSVKVKMSAESRVVSYFRAPNGDYVKGERILLSSGFTTAKVPLLDTHDDGSVGNVLGSVDQIMVDGNVLVGTVTLSSNEAGENALTLIREKHLTDVSIGAIPMAETFLEAGQSATFNGNVYQAIGVPLRLVTQSQLVELSLCPVGADPQAKISASAGISQADPNTKEKNMDPKDNDALIAQARTAERARISEIGTICQSAKIDDATTQKFIADGSSVEVVRQAAFNAMVAAAKPTPAPTAPNSGIIVGSEKIDQFRAFAAESLLQRGGAKASTSGKDQAIVQELKGMSLLDFAEESLRISQRSVDRRASKDEIIRQALTTSDFTNLFLNVGNKVALDGYNSVGFNWRLFCDVGSVNNFLTYTGIGITGWDGGLEEMLEGQEYTKAKFGDEKEQWSVKTYGKAFDVTRQAMINDDIGGIMQAARQRGELVGELIANLAVAPITANQTMGDGVAAFHATHGNLGTAGVISEAAVKEARIAMANQRLTAASPTLGYKPMILLGGAAQEEAAIKYFLANSPGSASGVVNPHYGMISRDNMLFDQRFTDASPTAWYFMAKPLVRMFFLNGVQTPYLETVQDPKTDGFTFKVRIDAGSHLMNWRAGFKNAGA